MIKTNELMTGDWVYMEANRGYEAQYIQVETIPDASAEDHYGHIGAFPVGGDNDFRDIEDKHLFPIPLTAEILEKNGWKHEFDKTEYMVKYELAQKGKDCWMMWAIKEHNLDIQKQDEKLNMYNLKVQRVCIPCDYVHQLQHALRLCEIEKEIKL